MDTEPPPPGRSVRKGKKRRRSSHGQGNGSSSRGTSESVRSDADPTHSTVECSSILNLDFESFAKKYPDFAKAWTDLKSRRAAAAASTSSAAASSGGKSSSSSFSTYVDSAFNLALTRAVLQDNFRLTLPSLPEGNLCPPVPNRLNYVLWLKILLEQSCDERYFDLPASSGTSSPDHESRHRFRGIDIGCGASCIYPLLLCTDHFCPGLRNECDSGGNGKACTFLATDVDEESAQSARQNVESNNLQDRIEVMLVQRTKRQMIQLQEDGDGSVEDDTGSDMKGPVRTAVEAFREKHHQTGEKSESRYDFCMTNPPFYATENEATDNRKGDGRSRTDMNLSEGVYPDGEVGFIRDMIADSFHLSQSITWFTSMVSKKSSLVELQRELRSKVGRGAVRSATFLQGKTTRWGIAWTHRPVALRSPATKVLGGIQSFEVVVQETCDESALDAILRRISSYCELIATAKNISVDCCVNDCSPVNVSASEGKLTKSCKISGKASGGSRDAFFIDVHLESIVASAESSSIAGTMVNVAFDRFSYSTEGDAGIKMFLSRFQGEVQQSNRRWRRMLAG